MERAYVGEEIATATQCKHLDQTLLRTIVGILGPSFALGNPYRLLLVVYGMVHIGRQTAGDFEHLPARHTAVDNETLVEPYKVDNPRVYEQIVAYGYFTGIKSGRMECNVEKGRVECDIAVVGYIGIARLPGESQKPEAVSPAEVFFTNVLRQGSASCN